MAEKYRKYFEELTFSLWSDADKQQARRGADRGRAQGNDNGPARQLPSPMEKEAEMNMPAYKKTGDKVTPCLSVKLLGGMDWGK